MTQGVRAWGGNRQSAKCVHIVSAQLGTLPAHTYPLSPHALLLSPALCRLSTVRNADQTVVMDKGRVAEVGTHSQLMRRGGIYAALVRRQSGAVLDQERDLAPHERQVSSNASSAGDRQPPQDGEGGSSGDPAGPTDVPGPDSLPQWKQQQRLKVEHDPA